MKIAIPGATGRSGIENAIDRVDLAAFLLDAGEDTTGRFRRRAPFVSW